MALDSFYGLSCLRFLFVAYLWNGQRDPFSVRNGLVMRRLCAIAEDTSTDPGLSRIVYPIYVTILVG